MPKVLVIGGNHDLGLEWTKHYLSQGWEVVATYRDETKSEGLFALKENKNLTIIKCDVTQAEDFKAFDEVNDINLVIYNAGTKGYTKRFATPDEITDEEIDLAHAVNAKGLNSALRALKSKLLAMPQSLFVYMSTGVSSTADNKGGLYSPYRASKAEANSFIRTWDIYLTTLWLAQNKPLEQRPLLFALTPGLIDIGMGKDVNGALSVKDGMNNMQNVIAHVSETQDTHALWTHDGKKLETYPFPNVINEYKEKNKAEVKNKEFLISYPNQLNAASDQLQTLSIEEKDKEKKSELRRSGSFTV